MAGRTPERKERKEPKGDKLEFDGAVDEALPAEPARRRRVLGASAAAGEAGRRRQEFQLTTR